MTSARPNAIPPPAPSVPSHGSGLVVGRHDHVRRFDTVGQLIRLRYNPEIWGSKYLLIRYSGAQDLPGQDIYEENGEISQIFCPER